MRNYTPCNRPGTRKFIWEEGKGRKSQSLSEPGSQRKKQTDRKTDRPRERGKKSQSKTVRELRVAGGSFLFMTHLMEP